MTWLLIENNSFISLTPQHFKTKVEAFVCADLYTFFSRFFFVLFCWIWSNVKSFHSKNRSQVYTGGYCVFFFFFWNNFFNPKKNESTNDWDRVHRAQTKVPILVSKFWYGSASDIELKISMATIISVVLIVLKIFVYQIRQLFGRGSPS